MLPYQFLFLDFADVEIMNALSRESKQLLTRRKLKIGLLLKKKSSLMDRDGNIQVSNFAAKQSTLCHVQNVWTVHVYICYEISKRTRWLDRN